MATALRAGDLDALSEGGRRDIVRVDVVGEGAEDAIVGVGSLGDDQHGGSGRRKEELSEQHDGDGGSRSMDISVFALTPLVVVMDDGDDDAESWTKERVMIETEEKRVW